MSGTVRLLPAMLFLTALVLVAPAAPGQTSSSRAVERGEALLREFKTREALDAFRAGLAEAPNDPTLLWKTARTLATLSAETPGQQGDEELLAEAVELARRAVEVAPQLSRAHTTLSATLGLYGNLLAHKYRIRKARAVIDMGYEVHAHALRAVKLDPSDFAPHVVLGVFHRELTMVNPIVKAVARTLLGGYPDVSLGESLAHLRRASELNPRDVTTRLELAKTLIALEREEGARRELQAVLALPARENLDIVEQRQARELLDQLG